MRALLREMLDVAIKAAKETPRQMFVEPYVILWAFGKRIFARRT